MPSWSKDGRWIYFSSNQSGEFQIWKMPAESGRAVQVTKNGGFEAIEAPGRSGFFIIQRYDKHEAMVWLRSSSGKFLCRVVTRPWLFKEAIYPRYWAMTDRGIYFVPSDWSRRPVIEFFSFATEQVYPGCSS